MTPRICWILLLLAFCCALAVLVANTTVRYFSYRVTTSITVAEESPMEFPAVTICNNNRYRKSVITQYPDIAQHIRSKYRGLVPVNFTVTEEFRRRAAAVDYEELLKNASHPFSEMILYCSFAWKAIPCETLTTTVVTSWGHCFTVNSADVIRARGGPLPVKTAGTNYALFLALNLNQADYYFGNDGDISAGIQVH